METLRTVVGPSYVEGGAALELKKSKRGKKFRSVRPRGYVPVLTKLGAQYGGGLVGGVGGVQQKSDSSWGPGRKKGQSRMRKVVFAGERRTTGGSISDLFKAKEEDGATRRNDVRRRRYSSGRKGY